MNTYGSSAVWHELPEHSGKPGTSVGWLNSYTNTGASRPFCSCIVVARTVFSNAFGGDGMDEGAVRGTGNQAHRLGMKSRASSVDATSLEIVHFVS